MINNSEKTNPIILSIVIPTLNRPQYIKSSLESLIESYSKIKINHEFIISDSGSSKDNLTIYETQLKSFSEIKIIRSNKELRIEESIEKCVEISRGKFIHIFGDDDLALPGLGIIIEDIISSQKTDLIYINRLIGDSNLYKVQEIAHPMDVKYGLKELPISDFIEEYRHWPGFIPSLVFSRKSWIQGLKNTSNKLEGYSFLEYIFRGNLEKKIIILCWPYIIQRRGIQAWKDLWPKYFYESMIILLQRMDEEGISKNALKNMMIYDMRTISIISDLLLARIRPKLYKRTFWKFIILEKTRSIKLRFFGFLIWIMPLFIAKFILISSPYGKKYGK